jgi:hypothetical protein
MTFCNYEYSVIAFLWIAGVLFTGNVKEYKYELLIPISIAVVYIFIFINTGCRPATTELMFYRSFIP